MKTMTIVLPWPSELLNPNKRPSRHQKAAKAKQARRDAGLAAHSAVVKNRWPSGIERITVQPVFFSPDNETKPRDKDNYAAMLKSTYDGLADAKVVVNDKGLNPLPPQFETDRDKRLELTITDDTEPPAPDLGADFVQYDTPFEVVRASFAHAQAQAIGYQYQGERQTTIVRMPDGKYERWDSDCLLGEFYTCSACRHCFVLQGESSTCPACIMGPLEHMAFEATHGQNIGKVFDSEKQEWVRAVDPMFLAIDKVFSDSRRQIPLIGSLVQQILESNKGTPEAAAAATLAPQDLLPIIRALPAMLELIKQFGRA